MSPDFSCSPGSRPMNGVSAESKPPAAFGWVVLACPTAGASGHGPELFRLVDGSERLLLRLQSLAQDLVGKRGMIMAISSQSRLVQEALAERLGIGFPLASDHDGRIANDLGLQSISLGRRHRLLPTLLTYAGRTEVARYEGFEAIEMDMQLAVQEVFQARYSAARSVVQDRDDAMAEACPAFPDMTVPVGRECAR